MAGLGRRKHALDRLKRLVGGDLRRFIEQQDAADFTLELPDGQNLGNQLLGLIKCYPALPANSPGPRLRLSDAIDVPPARSTRRR